MPVCLYLMKTFSIFTFHFLLNSLYIILHRLFLHIAEEVKKHKRTNCYLKTQYSQCHNDVLYSSFSVVSGSLVVENITCKSAWLCWNSSLACANVTVTCNGESPPKYYNSGLFIYLSLQALLMLSFGERLADLN